MPTRFPCPCCGFLTREEQPPGTYRICPVCSWEDDFVQYHEPDLPGGANKPSLNEARRNFAQFGAIEERLRRFVRSPHPDEMPSVP
jgi:rubredoxin